MALKAPSVGGRTRGSLGRPGFIAGSRQLTGRLDHALAYASGAGLAVRVAPIPSSRHTSSFEVARPVIAAPLQEGKPRIGGSGAHAGLAVDDDHDRFVDADHVTTAVTCRSEFHCPLPSPAIASHVPGHWSRGLRIAAPQADRTGPAGNAACPWWGRIVHTTTADARRPGGAPTCGGSMRTVPAWRAGGGLTAPRLRAARRGRGPDTWRRPSPPTTTAAAR